MVEIQGSGKIKYDTGTSTSCYFVHSEKIWYCINLLVLKELINYYIQKKNSEQRFFYFKIYVILTKIIIWFFNTEKLMTQFAWYFWVNYKNNWKLTES